MKQDIIVRKIKEDDQEFLFEMLYQSIYHSPGTIPPERSILKDPKIRHYVENWGRPGDAGYIALDKRTGLKLGAVWLRYFTSEEKGFGYLAADVPEIGIAVTAKMRGRGIGTTLMLELLDNPEEEFSTLSLSVDPENPASELYHRMGFKECGACGTSLIMRFDRKQVYLEDTVPYILREARPLDAQALVDYLGCIAGESNNLTFGPGEFTTSLSAEAEFIEKIMASKKQFFLVAVKDGKLIGTLHFEAGCRPRVSHAGEFGISVRKDFWGKRIGENLMIVFINWAQERGITKINLRVRTDNMRALALYKKFGFEVEGEIRREFCINGEYFNTYFMGKLLSGKD